MASLLLFNKPYRVLSQFTDTRGRITLADFIDRPGFYPAGRLDYDSEGLLLLCDDGKLQQQIADPRFKLWKKYLLQLEGSIDADALRTLATGVELKDGLTRPAKVRQVAEPDLPVRTPPIRHRPSLKTSWIEIEIREGRNRQLRRMAAAVGFPVLRLIRTAIGDWSLDSLPVGKYQSRPINLPRVAPTKKAGAPGGRPASRPGKKAAPRSGRPGKVR